MGRGSPSGPGLGAFNPTQGEPSGTKEAFDASVCPERFAGGLIICDQTEKAENAGESDSEIGNGRPEECKDKDFRSVTSLKEEVSFDDFPLSDPLHDDFLDKNMQMVLVEEEGQALAMVPHAEIEEILKLNLEGINVVDGVEEGCLIWVMQNIDQFSKAMVVSLEGMESISLLFYSEVEKRKMMAIKRENLA